MIAVTLNDKHGLFSVRFTALITGDVDMLVIISGPVRVVTTYRTALKRKPKQLTALRDETIGQWTDGVGAGCFANESKKLGVKLEYCADPRQITTKQEDDKPKSGGKPTRVTIFGAIKRGSIDGVRKALAAGEDLTVVREHMMPLMRLSPLEMSISYACCSTPTSLAPAKATCPH